MARLLGACALVLVLAACSSTSAPIPPARAAPPQSAKLDWAERFPARPPSLVFGVERFDVARNGWSAHITLTNRTRTRFSVGDPRSTLERQWGVMLFQTGDLRQLEQLNRARDLPPVRHADTFRPELPLVLERGATWRGVMSAPGSLAAGRWIRVVFGPLVAIVPDGEQPPSDIPDPLVWITDHAHQLSG